MTPDQPAPIVAPSRAEITAAAARIAPHIRQTPVLPLAAGAFGLPVPVELKLEQMQHTGSFKPRGAFNSLLAGDVPEAGVVAASGGNHGAAVAFAAARLGIPARIFVPEIAGAAKIGLIARTGTEPTVVPGAYADALAAAKAHEAATGAVQIHAYDAPNTVAGQGTLAREWEAQGLAADTVLIAVGGGGLIAGALAWFGGARRVVAVEPEGCATLARALAEGPEAQTAPTGPAANALGAQRIGTIAYQLARAQGIEAITVPDAALLEAQAALWRELRLLVEPAGACALAALLTGAYRPAEGERIAVLICGANPAPDPLKA